MITDNQFPYWVYGGQQESGSAGVASRGDYGAITWRDWRTIGVDEYGYVAPDPLDPNIIYGGRVTRFDKRTGQVQNVGPARGTYRVLRTAPVVFSPADKKTLYFAGNVLFKTTDGGNHWQVISPDLSRENPEVPEGVGVYRTPALLRMARRGVIYTVAPSFRDVNTIWVGTDDGLIHRTVDGGGNWKNITPPLVTAWSKVSMLEASHFDEETAYAAVNRLRLDDTHAHIYRTHDGGRTWDEIVEGIPDGNVVNSVREDPVRKGLLYAGTERAVFFSLDDGKHWQSLRMNMPATSIRDVVVHEDDLVVGTHGRGFWILDDVTPLRQIDKQVANSEAFLFKPAVAYRVRRSVNTDTPIPPEEPMGQNPPDGAIIDYWLKGDASKIVLEIIDAGGEVVRRYSESDPLDRPDENRLPYPSYWFRPARTLPTKAGMQRWVWDLRFAPLEGPRTYGMGAIFGDTPTSPTGPLAMPGEYTVKLTVDGRSYSQALTLKMDPRVVVPAEGIARMFEVTHKSYLGVKQARAAASVIGNVRGQLQAVRQRAGAGEISDSIAALDQQLVGLVGSGGGRGRGRRGAGRAPGEASFSAVAASLGSVMDEADSADAVPTEAVSKEFETGSRALGELLGKWEQVRKKDLTDLNTKLRGAGLPEIRPPEEQR